MFTITENSHYIFTKCKHVYICLHIHTPSANSKETSCICYRVFSEGNVSHHTKNSLTQAAWASIHLPTQTQMHKFNSLSPHSWQGCQPKPLSSRGNKTSFHMSLQTMIEDCREPLCCYFKISQLIYNHADCY